MSDREHAGVASFEINRTRRVDAACGFEWQAAPAHRKTVRRGLTAVVLDGDGKISRLTTVWDGAMLSDTEIKALATLALD